MTHLENENTRLVPCTCHSRLNLKEINKTIYTVVYFYVPSLKGKHTFNHKDYLQIKKFTLSMCKVILQVGGGGGNGEFCCDFVGRSFNDISYIHCLVMQRIGEV
jgi:hypothetical protein